MNGNKTRMWFYISALMVCSVLFSSCLKIEEVPSKEERINLALRQVGDKLYRYCGDSSSKIPPVETVSDIEYQLELENGVEYDALPEILEQTFTSFGISDQYIVSILDCNNNDILLGYNTVASNSDFMPCQGREKNDGCNILNIKLYEGSNISSSKFPWIYFLLGSMGFLFLLVKLRNKNAPIENTDQKDDLESKVNETVLESSIVKIGHSSFDSKLLTISHLGKSKSLTYREAKLFGYFVNNKNEVLKRDDIQSHVWEEEGVIVGRSLDVFISRLRKIIKSDDALAIKNIHGVGYRLEENL